MATTEWRVAFRLADEVDTRYSTVFQTQDDAQVYADSVWETWTGVIETWFQTRQVEAWGDYIP